MRVSAALVLAGLLALPAASVQAAPADTVRVGSLRLDRCENGTRWWCGSISRALDPARPRGPRIGIHFRWRQAGRGQARHPPIVAVEGGPGYPSTGTRVEYTSIFRPLLRDRNLLLVDNRGTGASALIDCPRIQRFTGSTSSPAFPRMVAGCARRIERRYRRLGRPAPHAADLFATSYAVDDLAAVLRRLRLREIDLYGDSYGTFFVQSFISRHQGVLHSVLLDSAYPVRDLDPWYASSGETARDAMDAVCERDPGCAAAVGPSETASERLGQLLERLRQAPISGRTRDSDGSRVRVRVGVRQVVDLVQDAATFAPIYRELDAAVRAALAGDNVPLLRLVAQANSYLHSANVADYFSNGLYFAVACLDYPQLFSMQEPPATRRAQLAERLLAPPVGAFDPFTAPEWLTVSAYTQPYQACLNWPRPARSAPPLPPDPAPLPADVPLLVVGGELDSLTPVRDAETLAPALADTSRVITVRNAGHVDSQGYTTQLAGTRCVRRIIRAFVREPAAIASLDASCAEEVPHVHTPGAYPLRLADAAPATLSSGDDPGEHARRAASVAAGALGDATIRRYYSGGRSGPGLRGGRFTAKGGSRVVFRLRRVRFVSDATVGGTGAWRPATGAAGGAFVVRPDSGDEVRVRVYWNQETELGTAYIGDSTLVLPAP